MDSHVIGLLLSLIDISTENAVLLPYFDWSHGIQIILAMERKGWALNRIC